MNTPTKVAVNFVQGSITGDQDTFIVNTVGMASGAFSVGGTWTATVEFEYLLGAAWKSLPVFPVGSTTSQTSTTANGDFTFSNPGFRQVRIRFDNGSSGTATLNFGQTPSSVGGASAGGGTAFPNEPANTVLAGPTTGSPAQPTFRTITTADLPATLMKTSDPIIGLLSVETFGAAGDLQSVTDATMAGSSAVVTSASNGFTNAKIGQLAVVNGAGAAGGPLTSSILSVQSSGQVTLNNASGTAVSGAQMIFGTDDTVAFQAALDSHKPVWVSNKAYWVHGSLGGANGENSQLRLPSLNYTSGTNFVNVGFIGSIPPASDGGYASLTDGRACALIFSDVASDGTGSIINGVGPVVDSAGIARTNVNLILANVEIRQVDFRHQAGDATHFGPSATGVNGYNLQMITLEDLKMMVLDPANLISTTGLSTWTTAPNWTGAKGIRLPAVANAQQVILKGTITVLGYPVGMSAGEHTTSVCYRPVACVTGLEIQDSVHPLNFAEVDIEFCKNGVAALNNMSPTAFYPSVNIACLAIEQDSPPTWLLGGNDIVDPNNRLRGMIRYRSFDSVNGGPTPLLRMNGGQYLDIRSLWNNRFPVVLNTAGWASVSAVPNRPDQVHAASFTGGSTSFGTGPNPYKDHNLTNPMFLTTTGPFSLCFMMNGTSTTNPGAMFEMRIPSGANIGGNGFVLGIKVDGVSTHKMTFYSNPPNTTVIGATTVDTGSWFGIGVSCSAAGRVHIYVNGALDATGTGSPGDFNSWMAEGGVPTGYTLGNAYDKSGTDGYIGKICDIRWFSSELSAADQLAYYNNSLLSVLPISQLLCNEGGGSTLFDSAA